MSYQSHFAFHTDKLQDKPTAFGNHNSAGNLQPGDCANSRNHNAPAVSARSYCTHQESGRTLLQLTYEPSLASLSRFFSNSGHPYGHHSALGSHRSSKLRASLASIANLLNFHTNGHIVHHSAVKGNRSVSKGVGPSPGCRVWQQTRVSCHPERISSTARFPNGRSEGSCLTSEGALSHKDTRVWGTRFLVLAFCSADSLQGPL